MRQSDPLYHTATWQKCRAEILARDNYLCQYCLQARKLTSAETVHHKKHLDKYPELALVADNLVSLCNTCHAKAHRRGSKGKEQSNRRARVVKG